MTETPGVSHEEDPIGLIDEIESMLVQAANDDEEHPQWRQALQEESAIRDEVVREKFVALGLNYATFVARFYETNSHILQLWEVQCFVDTLLIEIGGFVAVTPHDSLPEVMKMINQQKLAFIVDLYRYNDDETVRLIARLADAVNPDLVAIGDISRDDASVIDLLEGVTEADTTSTTAAQLRRKLIAMAENQYGLRDTELDIWEPCYDLARIMLNPTHDEYQQIFSGTVRTLTEQLHAQYPERDIDALQRLVLHAIEQKEH